MSSNDSDVNGDTSEEESFFWSPNPHESSTSDSSDYDEYDEYDSQPESRCSEPETNFEDWNGWKKYPSPGRAGMKQKLAATHHRYKSR